MYGIRNKETHKFLKLVAEREDGFDYFQLGFAPAIELNYYVNDSLGFISNILLRETEGEYDYEPELMSHINQNDLEVVSLIDGKIVSIEDLLDGQDVDSLPIYEDDKDDNNWIEVREEDDSIGRSSIPKGHKILKL